MKEKLPLFLISFITSILGCFQMYWFLPDGISCLNPNKSFLDAASSGMLLQFIFVYIILIYTKNKTRFYSLLCFLLFFWLGINIHEFTYKHACWSTFSNMEIIKHTLHNSIQPTLVCLSVFSLGYLLFKKSIDL